MKCLWWDFIMAPTAWRGAITAGKHDEMFLSTLPPRLSLTRRQHSGRLMKCFRRGCSGSDGTVLDVSVQPLHYSQNQANFSGQDRNLH